MTKRTDAQLELDRIDFEAHVDEINDLANRYWNTWCACIENAQEMGYEPWSHAEALEAFRQMRSLVDAGEAS